MAAWDLAGSHQEQRGHDGRKCKEQLQDLHRSVITTGDVDRDVCSGYLTAVHLRPHVLSTSSVIHVSPTGAPIVGDGYVWLCSRASLALLSAGLQGSGALSAGRQLRPILALE